MPDYGNPSYWDERYAADERNYDWYQSYNSLEEYIAPHLKMKPDFEILMAGCGNSSECELFCKCMEYVVKLIIPPPPPFPLQQSWERHSMIKDTSTLQT